MNISVNVSPGTKSLKELKKKLNKQEMARGISKAINQSLKEGREKAIHYISSSYNIPDDQFKKIQITQSNASKLEGNIYADGKPLPLGLFKPRYPKPGAGVTFAVIKGSRGSIKYAFMVDTKHVLGRGRYLPNSPYGFIRKRLLKGKKAGKGSGGSGMGTEPVTRMVTVSLNGAMNGTKNKDRIEKFIEITLKKNMKAELQRRIDKIKK